jgi:hypothetical protein
VCIISDGIEKLDDMYLTNLEAVGIYEMTKMKDFKDAVVKDGNEDFEIKYRRLGR